MFSKDQLFRYVACKPIDNRLECVLFVQSSQANNEALLLLDATILSLAQFHLSLKTVLIRFQVSYGHVLQLLLQNFVVFIVKNIQVLYIKSKSLQYMNQHIDCILRMCCPV